MLEYQTKTVDTMLSNLYKADDEDPYVHAVRILKNLKHPVLEGLLMTHVQIAMKLGTKIDFQFEADLDQMTIDDMTVAKAIGILVDNALESESNLVSISLTKNDDSLVFRVENTYKELNIEKGQWLSTKGRNRGHGLKSLQVLLDLHPKMSLKTQVTQTHVIKDLIFKEV